MSEPQICHWCMSEIVWDEEIGPETHCPHCDNELGGYRSLQFGLDPDEREAKDEEKDEAPIDGDDDLWEEPSEGFRGGSRSMLAAETAIQAIVDGQEEAPECPACRTYMLEAGVQTVGESGFQSALPAVMGQPIMPGPFQIHWYICPACFQTSSLLAPSERLALLDRLAEAERK